MRTPFDLPDALFRRLKASAALALLCVGGGSALAEDWPQFHGNQALTGMASGSLPEKPKLAWTFKTGGVVKSSAAICKGHVYVGSEDGSVYALNLDDGRKLWSFKTGGSVNSSPLVLQGRIFFGSEDECLYALDASKGTLLWKYQTGDKIIGGVNWAANGPRTNLMVGSYDSKLHCVDMETGKTNWLYDTGNYVNGTPAIAGGKVVFGGCDGALHILEIANGQQEGSVEAGSYIPGSAAMAGGKAYFGCYGNEVLCVDVQAAAKLWGFKDHKLPYLSSPAVGNDTVVIGGQDKLLHCLKRSDGTELWNFPTHGNIDGSPAICGNTVVCASDDGRVYFLSLAHGKELGSYDAGQGFKSSPAIAEGKVVIGCDDGLVYCFGK